MASTSNIEYVDWFGSEEDLDCAGCTHRTQRIKVLKVEHVAVTRRVELLL